MMRTLLNQQIDQANRHIERTRDRLKIKKEVPIYSIIVSQCEKINQEDLSNAKNIFLWKVSDFIAWAKKCFDEIETIKNTFSTEGNMFWYHETAKQIQISNFSCGSILSTISNKKFSDLVVIKNDV